MHVRAHLQALRALLVLAAAGPCRARTDDDRHGIHDDAVEVVLLFERPEEHK